MNRIVICIALITLVGCQKASQQVTVVDNENAATAAAPTETPKAKAMAAKKALFMQLSGRLMEVMGSEGPAAAIEVCSKEASEIAAKVGEKQGVKIGRTALKLRNSKNLPPDWAKSLMTEDATKPQFISVDDNTLGALLPIELQPQCMTCHGPKDKISEEVKGQLAKLYPDDTATGFETGDLRGWFWVEVPKKADGTAEAAMNDQAIMQYGKLREVVGGKQHHGRVSFAELTQKPHVFAVGALEGLRGEVTILDGEVVATEGISSTELRPRKLSPDSKAALLVGKQVAEWTEHKIDKVVQPEAFESFLEQLARSEGYDTSKPFLFTVAGQLIHAHAHVIRGACPVHAKRNGIELPETERPFEKTYEVLHGTLVGVFAKDSVGNLTHPDMLTHTHVVYSDPETQAQVTGHIERVGLSAGSVVRLPKL